MFTKYLNIGINYGGDVNPNLILAKPIRISMADVQMQTTLKYEGYL